MGEGPALRPVERSRAFRSARRHSRWVRFAKVAIPLGSLLGMAAVGFVAYYDPFRQIENLSFGSIGVSGTNVTMESPKLTGFKNDNRPYEVTASAATQDVRKPNFVQLKDLKARIVTDERGTVARLQAASGVLDTKREQMRLRDNIVVTTDAGHEVKLRSAFVRFKSGSVTSNEPVVVSFGSGTIEAEGLSVTDNGKVMSFTGRVRTIIQPSSNSASSAPEAAGTGSTVPAPQQTSVRP
ncbi:LPS export ABC transporter periplasmic protein LptC [Microvirga arsenatis]|uniref:LPS export ABC transporter periplasmic protein LptC n=1 Tax=Microvirga arsenatis TaxID=2692265 RepID=A0ABW9YVZ8_9HYPH|nr:LPS export ABC transporter periplasmic protein LptC [Microvirga arsenatis]NBJ09296.1 LPS export ABC transporter periplasmic protein LptC [Microvirga arsenatis]NBJ23846.1 LPS export ABC transporter periplasmic protein LptC [Microvirga arsenatis]